MSMLIVAQERLPRDYCHRKVPEEGVGSSAEVERLH